MNIKDLNIQSILKYLLASYGFTWLVWLPGILATRGILPDVPWPPLFGIGACGPLVAAVWLIKNKGGWEGVKRWLRAGFSGRIKPVWWVVILLSPFLVPPFALGFHRLAGGTRANLIVLDRPVMILPTLVLMLTIGGAQEEFGWRGYLLPQLDKIVKPWQADLFLTLFHVCWHIPLFFIAYTSQYHYSFWLFLAFGAGFTLLINTIYRGNEGSILAAVIFHGLTNAGLEIFPPVGSAVSHSPLPLLLIAFCYTLIAVLIRSLPSATLQSAVVLKD